MNHRPHKKQDYFMTNWGSCNIYSRAKVNAGAPPHKLLYIQLMGAIAEDGLKGGQTSVLCTSHTGTEAINPAAHVNRSEPPGTAARCPPHVSRLVGRGAGGARRSCVKGLPVQLSAEKVLVESKIKTLYVTVNGCSES